MIDNKKFIDIALAANIITKEASEKINRQLRIGDSLEDAVIKQGILSEIEFIKFLSKQLKVSFVNLAEVDLSSTVIQLIPYEFARKSMVVVFKKVGRLIEVAMTDPTDLILINDIKFTTGCDIEPYLATRNQIQQVINRHYKAAEFDQLMEDIQQEELEVLKDDVDEEAINLAQLQATISETPVVKYVDSLITGAIRKGASDIHIEPYEKIFRVRTRVDGILYEEPSPPFKLKNAVISRIKVMATLDIAEHRVPQDGRIKMRLQEREVDLRVSTLPTIYGEKVVMRVLDKTALCVDMEKLGFEKEDLAKFSHAINAPYGLILVTGPTGSGKTTTLYSALSRLNTTDVNIMTAEDPVEYNFVGINQVQMHESIGLTFAASLRSFLRQDPDIIMVGEIRDTETAEIAIRAALTGHLVLSTLHTNDAPSAISRLVDMGMEPFLITSSVVIIIAQRLMRKICPKCKEPVEIPETTYQEIGIPPEEYKNIIAYHGKGCPECNQGYRGRAGIYEVMPMTSKLKDLTLARRPTSELNDAAIKEGMLSLREEALLKFKNGITTLEEVIRVTASV
ncbi:MAG: type IV-A pilus assembly ATPase PilB [bacterium]|nr:type IV-A pilus assembly ATPase PilB [bacterium]